MSHVEKKLAQDFEDWRAEAKRNGTTNKAIKKDLEEFMETRFQIKPNKTEGEQLLTILDILDMMIAPDVDATVAANSVRENAVACKRAEERGNFDSAFTCSDPRFILSGNKCFHVSTAYENYANAVSACQGMGAELAMISSPADDELVSKLRGDSVSVLIGLNKNQGPWAWQDGSVLTSYTNWITWPKGHKWEGQQEPKGQGKCVLKYHDSTIQGGWRGRSCDIERKYACSKPAEDRTGCTYSCSSPRFTLLGDKCFYVSPVGVKADYPSAVNACKDMNANLAKISSLGEDVLVSAMRSGSGEVWSGPRWSPNADRGALLIGLNDKEKEGTWVWEDFSGVSYSNWIPGQPDEDEIGNCAIKYWNGSETTNGRWADTKCSRPNNYVCSTPAEEQSCDPEKAVKIMLHRKTCIHQQETYNHSVPENLPAIDVFLNPAKEDFKRSITQRKKNMAKDFFNGSNMKTLYPELFRLLWKSSLPCFKDDNEEENMLLSCELAGKKIHCSDIFTRVPTDTGICCALNVDDLLRESEYQNLVKKLQADKPTKRIKSQEGMRNGLKLTLDLHSNTVSFGTVDEQHNTFKMFIGEPAQFPMIQDKSLQVQPGREHFVDLSAKVVATNDIRHISPEARGCLFTDESHLEFYKSYTFSNCRLECRIKEADKKYKCIPWHLPKVGWTQ